MLRDALLATLLTMTCAAAAHAQVPVGEYVAVPNGGSQIDEAINRATADFNFIKRAVARHRLHATNPVARSLTIANNGDVVDVTLNGNLRVSNRVGATIPWRYNGESMKVTTSLEGGVLTNTFVADDGEKRNRYVLRSDGMLQLDVVVTSPQLKRPLEYTQLFRKIGS